MQTTQLPPSRRRAVMAMVLGTALAALSPAARAGDEAPVGAVQDISRYCTACWRNARLPNDRWSDCTQEVFERLLERVPTPRWPQVFEAEGAERQEFLRAIDTVKKRGQRDRQRATRLPGEVADRRSPQAQQDREIHEELQLAIERSLSARQQRIVRRICEGWSVADIAGELGLTPARVSDEKYKAIHKLRTHFAV